MTTALELPGVEIVESLGVCYGLVVSEIEQQLTEIVAPKRVSRLWPPWTDCRRCLRRPIGDGPDRSAGAVTEM